tara:strand:- start:35135 stop:36193 length:1059 start_codon:yes stop_codon:yes gene_type:complete
MELGPEHNPTILEKLRFSISLYTLTLFPHDPVTRPHWNEIIPGLILGGIPIQTNILGHGDHGQKIINQCNAADRPLSLVVAAIEKWELEGKGMGIISPVSNHFWTENGVNRHHIEMQDFTGEAPLDDIKAAVDAIHQAREKDESAYVHCKAGRGRSYLIVFCYLMMYENMDANQALSVIYHNRCQVSPSARQFATIEQFRLAFCPERKALNTDSDAFYPYRKDILSFASSAKLQAALTSIASISLAGMGVASAIVAGLFAKKGSEYIQHAHSDYESNQYLRLKTAQDNLSLDAGKTDAFNSGYESSTSWSAWAKSLIKPSAYLNYDKFTSGVKAGKEHDLDLHVAVNKPKMD